MNNPYTSRGALQDASMFIGREHELKELGTFIQGNQSVSIIGPRKIGKTSLMMHLMRAENLAALDLAAENIFVYIDCQMLSDSQHNQVFAHFCTEMAAALRVQGFEPEPSLKAAVSTPTRSAFEIALRKLNQRGLRVVLLLDEFEQLTLNPYIDVNLYNALRAAVGRLRLVFLTASSLPLIELTYPERSQKILSSPFFNIFAPLFIGLLSEREARSLIRNPMSVAEITVSSQIEDFIYELVGGHPLALQIACYYAWESPDDPYQIELQTKLELEANFQYYWHKLSAVEREVLRNPSETSKRESSEAALRVIFRSLIRKCLLVQIHGSYDYPSKAWEEFVLAQPDNSRPASLVNSATQITSDGTSGKGKLARDDLEGHSSRTHSSKTTAQILRRVTWESLPEMMGGLTAAMIIAVAGLIYRHYSLLIEIVKSIDGWTWLILATLGILVVAIVTTRIAFKRNKIRQ